MQPGTTLIKSQQRAEVTSDEMIILEKHPLKITEKISEKKHFLPKFQRFEKFRQLPIVLWKQRKKIFHVVYRALLTQWLEVLELKRFQFSSRTFQIFTLLR